MHSHVCGSQRAKFDDDDVNSFRGIACEGLMTHAHTYAYYITHIPLPRLDLKLFQSRKRLWNEKKEPSLTSPLHSLHLDVPQWQCCAGHLGVQGGSVLPWARRKQVLGFGGPSYYYNRTNCVKTPTNRPLSLGRIDCLALHCAWVSRRWLWNPFTVYLLAVGSVCTQSVRCVI